MSDTTPEAVSRFAGDEDDLNDDDIGDEVDDSWLDEGGDE